MGLQQSHKLKVNTSKKKKLSNKKQWICIDVAIEILKYCPLSMINQSKLVSKDWDNVITKHWYPLIVSNLKLMIESINYFFIFE